MRSSGVATACVALDEAALGVGAEAAGALVFFVVPLAVVSPGGAASFANSRMPSPTTHTMPATTAMVLPVRGGRAGVSAG